MAGTFYKGGRASLAGARDNQKEGITMLGNWKFSISGDMPQKVASAMGALSEKLVGAEYDPICYLGSQAVNGTNHAVLAEQVLTTGRDTKNVVLIIFNERPGDMELTLVSIERVLEGGLPMGGITVDPCMYLPDEAVEVWSEAFEGFVGSDILPVCYLGSQIVKGINYIFAAQVNPLVVEKLANQKLAVVIINSLTKQVAFSDLLSNKTELGYAFTWMKP